MLSRKNRWWTSRTKCEGERSLSSLPAKKCFGVFEPHHSSVSADLARWETAPRLAALHASSCSESYRRVACKSNEQQNIFRFRWQDEEMWAIHRFLTFSFDDIISFKIKSKMYLLTKHVMWHQENWFKFCLCLIETWRDHIQHGKKVPCPHRYETHLKAFATLARKFFLLLATTSVEGGWNNSLKFRHRGLTSSIFTTKPAWPVRRRNLSRRWRVSCSTDALYGARRLAGKTVAGLISSTNFKQPMCSQAADSSGMPSTGIPGA